MKKNTILKSASLFTAILLLLSIFASCSGDMHDGDESTKSAIVLSLQDQKITLPKDFIFYKEWWISGTTGTYGEYSFSAAKVEIDEAGYESKLILTLSDGTTKTIKNTLPSTGQYTLETEMTFSTKGATASSLSFNGDKLAK